MKRSLLLFALCVCALGAQAEVYKWIDENGKVQYGDAPPKSAKARVVSGGVTVVPATVIPATPAQQSAPVARANDQGARAGNSAGPAPGPKADGNSLPASTPADPATAARQEARMRAIERCRNGRGVDCENEVDAQIDGQPGGGYAPGVIPGWSQPPIRPMRPPPSAPRPATPVAIQKARPSLARESASTPAAEPRTIKPMR